LREMYWWLAELKLNALSRWFIARSNATMNLYLSAGASARSQRRRHFSMLPLLPARRAVRQRRGRNAQAALAG